MVHEPSPSYTSRLQCCTRVSCRPGFCVLAHFAGRALGLSTGPTVFFLLSPPSGGPLAMSSLISHIQAFFSIRFFVRG